MFKQKFDCLKAFEFAAKNKDYFSHIYPSNVNGPTITIKDVFATTDAPTQASSKILDKFNSGYDATVVKKIREANMSLVGKTHLDELALGGTGLLSAYGKIVNPLDKTRIIGGSSSGAAASIVDENTVISIGTDTGDSVRLPASYVGKVGFKPSYGAVSRYGLFGFSPSLDTVGWFSHNVHDAIVMSGILYGRDDNDMTSVEFEKPKNELVKPQTVAILKHNGEFDKYMDDKFKELEKKLIEDGVKVNYVSIDNKLLEHIQTIYEVISYSEVSSTDANLTGIPFGNRAEGSDSDEIMINTRSQHLGQMVQRRFALGSYYLLSENQEEIYVKSQKVRRLLQNALNDIVEKNDVIIFGIDVAPKISSGKSKSWTTDYSAISNLVGSPSVTLPWFKHDNMPVGLLMDAKMGEDKKLLSHALYIEQMIGGNHE